MNGLTEKEAQARIEALTLEIERHNYLYYVKAEPEVSDAAFDALIRELESLEKEFPQLARPDSPTQRVGGTINKEFVTVRHKRPMKSLSNIYDEKELDDFDARVQKNLGGTPYAYIAQLKIDGVALSLTYENGLLVRGVTRGDGELGDDITANVKTIRNIPLRLRTDAPPSELEVRGEVYMRKPDFDALNAERSLNNEALLANPRNTTAGTIKQQDSTAVAKRKLVFTAYQFFIEGAPEPVLDSDGLTLLAQWGFYVSPQNEICKDLSEVKNYIQKWETEREKLDFETDGAVIKLNELKLREELGQTAKSPRWAVAYKYQAEEAETILTGVEYQVGRTGAITPVAQLHPVLLAGSTVKRASLYNFDEIDRLSLHIGDWVFVAKSGEIIPKVLRVNVEKRKPEAEKVIAPKECPACGAALVRSEKEAASYCPNVDGCPPQIKGRIEHFASRKAMDIDGLGTEIVGQLVEAGLIKDFIDLYALKYEDLIALERFADKSAKNLIIGIEKSKEIPFERLLYALGIRFVGENVADKLAQAFRTMEKLSQVEVSAIQNVYEIGERIAQSVYDYFRARPDLPEKLARLGLQTEAAEKAPVGDKLSGQKFLISGTFEGYDRDALKKQIADNGGVNVTSVSKNLDYLVAGDKIGPAKLTKAAEVGVKIISIEEFFALLNSEKTATE